MIKHAFIHRNIRVSRNAENALTLHTAFSERMRSIMANQLFHQSKFCFPLCGCKNNALKLVIDRNQAQRPLHLIFIAQHRSDIRFIVAQKRERMAFIYHLHRKHRQHFFHKVLFPKMLLLFRQLFKVHFVVAAVFQALVKLCHALVAILLKLLHLRHNRRQLLSRCPACFIVFGRHF